MTRVEHRPLVLFSNQYCTITFRQEKHGSWVSEASSDYALLYAFDGQLNYQSAETKLVLNAGSFVLSNPTTTSTGSIRNAAVLRLALTPSLVIDCSARMRLGASGNEIILRANEPLVDANITRVVEDLAREMREGDVGHEAVIAVLVEQIVIQLLRHYSTFRRADSLELSRVGLVDRRIRRAIELMFAQLDQELSLKDLAAVSYLSPFHFSRLFKKLTGATPHAYLAALRTQTAERLLADTELSIGEISARVGYSSPSHFSKAFRQATGISPRTFRASLIGKRSRT